MKKILLQIEDDAYSDIKREVNLKSLKVMMGNSYGLSDNLLSLLIKNIDNGKEEITVYKKGG